jgi:hypothetical protein
MGLIEWLLTHWLLYLWIPQNHPRLDMDNIRLDNIPLSRRRQLLRDHPDTIMVEYQGEERPWFFGGATYDAARDEVNLNEVLEQHEESEAGIDAFCYLLWAGFAVFGTDLTPAEIKLTMSVKDMNRLQKKILPAIQGDAGEVGNAPAPETNRHPEQRMEASPGTSSGKTATAPDSVATAS